MELIGDVLAKKDRSSERPLEVSEQLSDVSMKETKGAPYEVDFAVLSGSMILGHTPKSAGLCHLPGVTISRLSRRELGGIRCSPMSNDWVLEVGDLITVRCSPEGVVAMRRFPGVYALRGLHCHQALGGRRHERRLYESVVASGSGLIGQSLSELLGLADQVSVPWCVESFRGYPLAASRRPAAAEAHPLGVSEPLLAGDVLLIDAFEGFPGLPAAQELFLISGLVPRSRAPRHGRATDMWRGAMAVFGLIVALVLDLQKRCNILVGTMVVAGLLLVTSGVKPNQIAARNSA